MTRIMPPLPLLLLSLSLSLSLAASVAEAAFSHSPGASFVGAGVIGRRGARRRRLAPRPPPSLGDERTPRIGSGVEALSAASSAGSAVATTGVSALLSAFRSSNPAEALAALSAAAATSLPPSAYFWALLSAGIGMPMSEDALCVFAGTVLPTLAAGSGVGWTHGRRGLILALYGGIVLSDLLTFSVGRALRAGVLEPVRRRLTLTSEETVDEEVCDVPPDGDDASPDDCHPPSSATKSRRRKRDRVLSRLEQSGNWTGFVTRFSLGLRGPLMLLAGFSGKITLPRFMLGTMAGAACTLPLQLGLGYAVRDNLGAAVGVIGTVGAVAIGGPMVLAAVGWMGMKIDAYRNK